MDGIYTFTEGWRGPACIAVSAVVALYVGRRVMRMMKNKRLRAAWAALGKDVVLVHQFQRGKFCPNLSPFALKVECFLRLAAIKYEVDTTTPFGPKGKCPWISLNGEDLGDSEFILDRLSDQFEVNLDSDLDPRKAAGLEAVRVLADEHLFWCVITWRYWLDGSASFLQSQSFPPLMRRMFVPFMKMGIRKRAREHGIGKHSEEEIFAITKKNCATLSTILGNFWIVKGKWTSGDDLFFGGERPSRADCAVFGQVAQLRWNAPGSRYEALVTDTYPNLSRYCDRMKSHIFPDWEKLLKLE